VHKNTYNYRLCATFKGDGINSFVSRDAIILLREAALQASTRLCKEWVVSRDTIILLREAEAERLRVCVRSGREGE
jgi:hypothetical protein